MLRCHPAERPSDLCVHQALLELPPGSSNYEPLSAGNANFRSALFDDVGKLWRT